MIVGYARLSRSFPEADEQICEINHATLPEGPVDGPIFVDIVPVDGKEPVCPERARMIDGLVRGDVVVISSASRLGISASDILQAMESIAAKGASLFDASVADAIVWGPEIRKTIDFVLRGQTGLRLEKMEEVRAARTEKTMGGAPRIDPDRLAKAENLFFNPEIPMREVVKETGISQRSLYRYFKRRRAGLPGNRGKGTDE